MDLQNLRWNLTPWNDDQFLVHFETSYWWRTQLAYPIPLTDSQPCLHPPADHSGPKQFLRWTQTCETQMFTIIAMLSNRIPSQSAKTISKESRNFWRSSLVAFSKFTGCSEISCITMWCTVDLQENESNPNQPPRKESLELFLSNTHIVIRTDCNAVRT